MRLLRWAGRFWTGVLVVAVALAGLLLATRLMLPLFGTTPALRAAQPNNNASAVAVRAPLTLHFDQAMNTRSVEAALHISPTLQWANTWDAAHTTITLSPTTALQPDTEYLLTLGASAQSQRFRAVGQALSIRFRTAPAPVVVAALPLDGATDVPLDSPISIAFSRAIVPATALQQPAAFPALHFEPPLAGQATWLDSSTVLFRPATRLQPGMRYQATLDAALTDVNGGQLGTPYSWTFSTTAPRLLEVSPGNNDRLVLPRSTLVLTFSQPLALDALRATLAISPTIAGTLEATTLLDGRQRVLFTPDTPLRPDTTYTVTLQAGIASVQGNLPLLESATWHFTTAPQPSLVARFPGEGQTLPPEQEIRLVFTTPLASASVRDMLRIEPAAPNLRVSANSTDVRIQADLRAATVYTLTLPAELPDQNGIPLGRPYQMRFLTAPARPALALPELTGQMMQATPGTPARLLVRRTNLSSLNLELYRLDEATLVRVLPFQASDWPGFQPERYGQALLRGWRIGLHDPLNIPVDERLALSDAADDILPPGAYYLRIRSLEGPRADVVLLVSPTRLTFQSGMAADGSDVVWVWATDSSTGAPASGLPLALYQGGVLVQQATSNTQGLVRFGGLGHNGSGYIAIVGGPQISMVSAVPNSTAERRARLFLTTDRLAYAPGDRMQLAGFVRVAGEGAFPPVSVSLSDAVAADRVYQTVLQPGVTGAFSATVPLPADLPLGNYTISASVGGSSAQATVLVQSPPPAQLRVDVQPPGLLAGGEDVAIGVALASPEGFPVASATISWTLTAARSPFPNTGDFVFGDDERATTLLQTRMGIAQSDATGRVALSITDLDLADVPLRYRFVAEASGPGGARGAGVGEFTVAPAARSAGLRLQSRIFLIGRPGTVDLLALDASGQPAPRTPLRLEVYQRTWERAVPDATAWVARDRIALSRTAIAGTDGTASIALTLPRGGAYRLRVSTPDSASNASYSAISLWASAPGFTGWGALPGDQPLLIADRPTYRPGDTATLLLVGLNRSATILLSQAGTNGPQAEVRAIRAGEAFTLTVVPSNASVLTVATLIVPQAARNVAFATPAPVISAIAHLPIASADDALRIAIQPDQASYLPGSTATITITATRANGAGATADIVLAAAAAAPASSGPIAEVLRPPPRQLQTAPTAGTPATTIAATRASAIASTAAPSTVPGIWQPGLRTNGSGILTVTLQLPSTPGALQLYAWAASPDRAGAAQATIPITQPLEVQLLAPPTFRANDQPTISVRLHNTSAMTQSISATLTVAGLALASSDTLAQQADLAPGATRQLTWHMRVLDAAAVQGSIAILVNGTPWRTERFEHPIIANVVPTPGNQGLALLREYLDPQTGQAADLTRLRAGQLLRARLTLVCPSGQRNLVLNESLPAGAVLVAAPSSPFEITTRVPGVLVLTKANLGAGVFQYEYTLRLVAAGHYAIPASSAQADGGIHGVGQPTTLNIAAP